MTITDPCFSAKINLEQGVIPDLSPSFLLTDDFDVQQFQFEKAFHDVTTISCPQLIFTLANADDTEVDEDVFTFSSIKQTLTTATSAAEKAKVYELKLTATMQGYRNSASKTFKMTIVDPCTTDSLTIDQAHFTEPDPVVTYDLGDEAIEFSWSESNVASNGSLSTCGSFTFSVKQAVDDSEIDETVFTLGQDSKSISV